MNRLRLAKLEKKMKPVPPSHYIDEKGWHVIGGGKGAAGVLYTPSIQSKEEWLAGGKKRAEASEDQF